MTVNQTQEHYATSRPRGLPVYTQNGKLVGQVIGDTLVKTVHSSRHLLRKPKAWALDVTSLNQARALGAQRVKLCDADTGVTFEATLQAFDLCAFDLDRGFGQQRALPLEQWATHGAGEPGQGAGANGR